MRHRQILSSRRVILIVSVSNFFDVLVNLSEASVSLTVAWVSFYKE